MSTENKRETYCVACEVHYALPHQPLCPSCLADEAKRTRERGKAS